ncbi:helix-turn-helix transcriptional regulator [Salininema proteolyticum]|uniref:LuxR C-terminal-related transcriptional regulator n=1 Tax=Salininema proteolyticum TaxID=1607685 RepID=A0ABV8U179_9ACTN
MSHSPALPPAAEQLYGTLVHLPAPVDADEACQTAEMDPEEFAAAVAHLASVELIEVRDGRLHPRSPKSALYNLIASQQDSLTAMMETLPALSKHYRHGIEAMETAPMVEKVTGREDSVRELNRLVEGAADIVQVFERPPFGKSGPFDGSGPSPLSRGAAVQVVYESSVLSLPDRVAGMEARAGLGEESRIRDRLPFHLFLVDSDEAAIPLGRPGRSFDSVLLVHSSVLTEALSDLFAALWELSVPAFSADRSAVELSVEERELLRFLAAGIKDEAIARRLHVSPRTVSRRVNALLERMGGTNRFQAGLLAAKRGWI